MEMTLEWPLRDLQSQACTSWQRQQQVQRPWGRGWCSVWSRRAQCGCSAVVVETRGAAPRCTYVESASRGRRCPVCVFCPNVSNWHSDCVSFLERCTDETSSRYRGCGGHVSPMGSGLPLSEKNVAVIRFYGCQPGSLSLALPWRGWHVRAARTPARAQSLCAMPRSASQVRHAGEERPAALQRPLQREA